MDYKLANRNIINQAKALNVCTKHVGSKPIRRLKNGIKQADESFKIYLKNKHKY